MLKLEDFLESMSKDENDTILNQKHILGGACTESYTVSGGGTFDPYVTADGGPCGTCEPDDCE